MNAQIGEIFRACYRYGRVEHSEKLRDAKKIKFYAEAEIERIEGITQDDKININPDSDMSPAFLLELGALVERYNLCAESVEFTDWSSGATGDYIQVSTLDARELMQD